MKINEKWLPLPQLDLEGNSFIRIENHQGILDFSDQLLKLRMKGMIYQVEGERLWIKGVTKREIFVEGNIKALRIVEETAQ